MNISDESNANAGVIDHPVISLEFEPANIRLPHCSSSPKVNNRPLPDLGEILGKSEDIGLDLRVISCKRQVARELQYKNRKGKVGEVNNRHIGFRPSTPIIPSTSSFCNKLGKNGGIVPLKFSPSYYPSPLDRIRSGKRERAFQLGINTSLEKSFEKNQSFPRVSKAPPDPIHNEYTISKFSDSLSKFQGVELDSYCFSSFIPSSCKTSILHSNDSIINHNDSMSTEASCVHSLLSGSNATASIGSPVCSPHKAVVVVEAKTLKIIMANDIACNLFELSSENLCTKRLTELFVRFQSGQKALSENLLENKSGQEVLISGKVLEALTSTGEVVPVSLWMRKLKSSRNSDEINYLAVMEIVHRVTANVSFNSKGEILQNDFLFGKLFGFDIPDNLIGYNIHELIPSLSIPHLSKENFHFKNHKRQYCTGRTKEGVPFPLKIHLKSNSESLDADKLENQTEIKEVVVCESNIENSKTIENESQHLENSDSSSSDAIQNSIYFGCIWVFANISGMITLLPDGEIHSCNHYFANMLFGYSQKQLIGKNISFLIPSFYDDLKFLDAESLIPPFEEEEYEDDEGDTDAVYGDLSLSAIEGSNGLADALSSLHLNELGNVAELDPSISFDVSETASIDHPSKPDINGNPTLNSLQLNISFPTHIDQVNSSKSTSLSSKKNQTVNDISFSKNTELLTSSSSFPSPPSPIDQNEILHSLNFEHEESIEKLSNPRILEGSYFGLGRHQDGSEIAIVYQVRMVELEDGQTLFCMWVSRDPDEPAEWYRDNSFIGMLSNYSSIYDSISVFESKKDEDHENSKNSVMNKSEDYSLTEYARGAYSLNYTTLQQIGKGSYGCVKLACRNVDKAVVVTKFICKSKVYKECWVSDNNLQKMVPLEISLLMTLDHPNIVKVLDVYENENYFQMIMERHGHGMDLFEFIDRSPNVDEPLSSYIFRQIVSAVSYLHNLNILHRDIKDENIIIDNKFNVKLIDFGSAAFMSPNRTFSTFCGTFEYCSPEVLNGEKYLGPELEMWSLGVTLYTLVYGENPFRDIEETIQAALHFSYPVSFDLLRLISHMLHPDPNLRCTLRELETNVWINEPVDIENYRFENVVQYITEEEPLQSFLE